MADSSLSAPWTGILGDLDLESVLEKELSTLTLIHKKNLEEFNKQADSVKAGLAVGKNPLVKPGYFCALKDRYLQEEKKILDSFKEYETEYNKLTKEESQLLHEISELDKASQKLQEEDKTLQEKLKSLKKAFKYEKAALNEATKTYCETFGINVAVKDSKSDVFEATVSFEETDALVKFTINRISKEVLDFDATPFISSEKQEQLKANYLKSKSTLALFSTLRRLLLKKKPESES